VSSELSILSKYRNFTS